jgi:hypothetical protein
MDAAGTWRSMPPIAPTTDEARRCELGRGRNLLALWQRWWPDRPGLELLDDKMQAGYARDAENDSHAAVVTWLDAWSDVLRLCDATGISSIGEFDDRFPLSQMCWVCGVAADRGDAATRG